MAGRAKKGDCPQDLWFLQNKKDASKTEKEEMILADTVRVSSEVMGQVRERQEFANRWLGLSLCQILK